MIELTVPNVSAMWHKEHSADHIYSFCILGMGVLIPLSSRVSLFISLFVHRFSTFVMHARFARNVQVSWNFPHVIGSAAQVSWQLYGAIAEYPATPTWRVGILCIMGWKTTGTIVIQWDANELRGILQPSQSLEPKRNFPPMLTQDLPFILVIEKKSAEGIRKLKPQVFA